MSIQSFQYYIGSNVVMTDVEDIELLGVTIEDQDFVAHTRQDIPKLLQEIKLSRQKLSSLK